MCQSSGRAKLTHLIQLITAFSNNVLQKVNIARLDVSRLFPGFIEYIYFFIDSSSSGIYTDSDTKSERDINEFILHLYCIKSLDEMLGHCCDNSIAFSLESINEVKY